MRSCASNLAPKPCACWKRANTSASFLICARPGGVDGAQVHSWISANRPDLIDKVVIITGDYANEETVTTLRKIGALYLEKPFRVQDLISAVEKTMGKAR